MTGGEYIPGPEYMSNRAPKSRIKAASEVGGMVWKWLATSGGGRVRNSLCHVWFAVAG